LSLVNLQHRSPPLVFHPVTRQAPYEIRTRNSAPPCSGEKAQHADDRPDARREEPSRTARSVARLHLAEDRGVQAEWPGENIRERAADSVETHRTQHRKV